MKQSKAKSLEANSSKCNEQDLAHIAWTYAVANVEAPSLFNDDFMNAYREGG